MLNNVQLIGRLGSDVQIHVFPDGNKKGSMQLATSEHFKNKQGEKKEVTQWHTVVLHNKLANSLEQYLKKGSLIHAEGKITYRSYETDGVTKYLTEIEASKITLIETKKD